MSTLVVEVEMLSIITKDDNFTGSAMATIIKNIKHITSHYKQIVVNFLYIRYINK